MFIELTDHLRCPRDHPEAFLVLLPERMEQRDVVAGHLGCPVCGWGTAWTDSVPDFGDAWSSAGTPSFDAAAAHAMLGIDGPGGWVALAGNAGALEQALAPILPGVNLVLVNPPASLAATRRSSAIVTGSWPLKTHALRGVILGNDVPTAWLDAALSSTLPGLRTIGCDPLPSGNVSVLGHADGVWAVTHQ